MDARKIKNQTKWKTNRERERGSLFYVKKICVEWKEKCQI